MFKVNGNKGFHLEFENGYTLSTQFGYGSYCDNYNKENSEFQTECKNSEIAIICPNGDFLPLNDVFMELFQEEIEDVVCGQIEINKWINIMNYVNNIEKGE